MTLFLGLENPLTSVKICLRSRWFIWSSVINADSTRRPLGVLHFARAAQAPERRNEKKNAVKNLEKPKNEAPAPQLPWFVPDCAKWKKWVFKKTSGRLQSGRLEVAKGKGPMALMALMALYNSVCRAQASEISDLKFSTAACMASSLHRWRQSTTHQTRWHLTRRKKHSCKVKVFLDLGFSLSRMMIVVWLLVIFGHAFRRSLWDSVNVFRRNSCHSSWATSHGFSL